MHSAIGHTLILVALAASMVGTTAGFLSGWKRNPALYLLSQRAVAVFGLAMVLANLTMVKALLQHDFSVSYVAQVGSRATPTWVTIVSLWSSLEGSILLWGAILGIYVMVFAWTNRERHTYFMPYALGTCMSIALFFSFLMAEPANPFGVVSPAPLDGPGPNALLQNHILMSIHPPMLYLGYVGMTVPFSIAVAGLLRGSLSSGWLVPLRFWTLIPWTFLTVGIILGGWWAYEVLGWGGYWAWDPVENASFLPWLSATAYLHSTVVQERRKVLKAWTVTLVLATFLLTILGTFMTRSGIFNSVHSFTQSSIGPMFLGFLAVCTFASMLLLASRSHLLDSDNKIDHLVSREGAFLLNNVVLVILTFTVLLGTVFPLVTEAVRGTKVSVGEPYFNAMTVPLGMVLVFLMGVGPSLPWGRTASKPVLQAFIPPALIGIALVALSIAVGYRGFTPLTTFGLCGFAFAVNIQELVLPSWQRARERNEFFGATLWRTSRAQPRRYGGMMVHLGVIVIIAAIAGSKTHRVTAEASLLPGESMSLGGYTLTYRTIEKRSEAHVERVAASLIVQDENGNQRTAEPSLNRYPNQREPIGTPHVETFGGHDLYLSLMSFDLSDQRVGLKVYVIPMVPWLWWMIPVLVLGSLFSLIPRGRRKAAAAPRDALPAAP